MYRRRDRLGAFLSKKSVLEDLFKSVAWMVLVGTMFKLAYISGQSKEYVDAVMLLISSLLMFSFILAYVCLHILAPMAKSMEPPFGSNEDKLRSLTGYKFIKEKVKCYIARPFIFYMAAALTYFIFGNTLANVIVKQL